MFPPICDSPSPQEARTGAQGRSQKQKAWRNATPWMVPHGLLILLSYLTQEHLSAQGDMADSELYSLPSRNSQDSAPQANLMKARLQEELPDPK